MALFRFKLIVGKLQIASVSSEKMQKVVKETKQGNFLALKDDTLTGFTQKKQLCQSVICSIKQATLLLAFLKSIYKNLLRMQSESERPSITLLDGNYTFPMQIS